MNPINDVRRANLVGGFALILIAMLALLIAAEAGRQITSYAVSVANHGDGAHLPFFWPGVALAALFCFFTAAGAGLIMAFSLSSSKSRVKGAGTYPAETLAALEHLIAAVGRRTDLTPEAINRFESVATGLFDTEPRGVDPLAERVALGDTLAAANDLADRWRLEFVARLEQAANLIQPFSPERAKALRSDRDNFLRIDALVKAEADAKAEQKKRDEDARKVADDTKKAEEERKRLDELCRAEKEKLKNLLDSMRAFCRCEQHAQRPCNCTDHSCSVCRCPKCRDGFDRAADRHKIDIEFFM